MFLLSERKFITLKQVKNNYSKSLEFWLKGETTLIIVSIFTNMSSIAWVWFSYFFSFSLSIMSFCWIRPEDVMHTSHKISFGSVSTFVGSSYSCVQSGLFNQIIGAGEFSFSFFSLYLCFWLVLCKLCSLCHLLLPSWITKASLCGQAVLMCKKGK